MELSQLKAQWNDVLNHLESHNRIAWMAFFDARLASLEAGVLTLDFRDASKLAGAHDIKASVSSAHQDALLSSIKDVTGETMLVVIS